MNPTEPMTTEILPTDNTDKTDARVTIEKDDCPACHGSGCETRGQSLTFCSRCQGSGIEERKSSSPPPTETPGPERPHWPAVILAIIEEVQEMPRPAALQLSEYIATRLARVIDRTFQTEQWQWVCETFLHESAAGVYSHLLEEVRELGEDLEDAEELADCFLLLQCLASHAGVDLADAARAKFEKCKRRAWKKTERGYRHVKDQEKEKGPAPDLDARPECSPQNGAETTRAAAPAQDTSGEPKWKPMDVVFQDTLRNPRCLILSIDLRQDGSARYEAVSESDGMPSLRADSSMTKDEWLRWLNKFSDDLTGREMRELREAAEAPLIEPESWGEFRRRFAETGDPWIH